MNDAIHILHRRSNRRGILKVSEMHERLQGLLGLENLHATFNLGTLKIPKERKYVDDPEAEKTEDMVRSATKRSGLPFVEVAGEAAFYKPKIDFQMKQAIGREETISTNQLGLRKFQENEPQLCWCR